ncbi:hypothetical protein DPEC_G00247490 [Dallia pectoralis]|uniref:Uncharacterized protein n=1 Tax=Dallia pectoralis TaxID=75939 RepID=A0ACC2FWS6_DALPE|nr:hypothetical protein DPEC_G00247490 [Dallia pectoralis]
MVLLKSAPPPSDGVRHKQAETTAVLDGKGLGTGTLYVTETRLSWFDGSGMGFSLEYPTISLHAISRDLSAYPQEHLYVMVNAKLTDENETEMHENALNEENANEDESSDEDESEVITEIRFVPRDKDALESMFSAMCECQALHPDPDDEDSDGDFDGDEYDVEEAEHAQGDISSFVTYEEGVSGLTAEGQATLQRLEGMLAQSVADTFHMAGVRTDAANGELDDGMEVDTGSAVAGQFEDADVDHW